MHYTPRLTGNPLLWIILAAFFASPPEILLCRVSAAWSKLNLTLFCSWKLSSAHDFRQDYAPRIEGAHFIAHFMRCDGLILISALVIMKIYALRGRVILSKNQSFNYNWKTEKKMRWNIQRTQLALVRNKIERVYKKSRYNKKNSLWKALHLISFKEFSKHLSVTIVMRRLNWRSHLKNRILYLRN